MSNIFTYKDLTAWRDSMELVETCYKITKLSKSRNIRSDEPIRRAAVSIPSNIAEGHCRRSTRAYLNHVSIALGSHGELATCMELAPRLGYIDRPEVDRLQPLSDAVGKMLYGLYSALERKILTP